MVYKDVIMNYYNIPKIQLFQRIFEYQSFFLGNFKIMFSSLKKLYFFINIPCFYINTNEHILDFQERLTNFKNFRGCCCFDYIYKLTGKYIKYCAFFTLIF